LTFIPDADDFVLSADKRYLAISMKNGNVEIWSIDARSPRQTISHVFPEEIVHRIKEHKLLPYYVGGIAFSSDSSQMAVGYVDGKIELWQIGETAPYVTLQHDSLALWQTDISLLFELSFSPDNRTLIAFKFEPYINANRLTFWSLPEGKLISVSDAGRYYQMPKTAYLPDGKTLLVFARDDSYLHINLWNVETGTRLNEFGTGLSRINSTELAPSGDQLTLYGWDTQENYYRQVYDLPQGKLLENEQLDQIPEDQDLSRFKDLLLAQGHYNNSWGNDDHPRAARLVNTENMPIQIAEENYLLTLPDGMIKPSSLPQTTENAYYDPRGKYVAWCEPGELHILDQDGKTTSTDLPFSSNCDGVTVSSQKHYAAVWKGNTFYLVNVATAQSNKASFNRKWEPASMLSASFSADEQLLISSKTGLITVWQVNPFHGVADSDKENQYIGNNIEVALSESQPIAVSLSVSKGSTSDRTSQLLVWRTQDAFPLRRANPPFIGSSQPMFTSFARSSDGNFIATGDDFGGIRFWNLHSGEELASYEFESRPLDLGFTSQGSGLVVVLADGTIRLLGVP